MQIPETGDAEEGWHYLHFSYSLSYDAQVEVFSFYLLLKSCLMAGCWKL